MVYEIVFPSERVERSFQKALSKIPTDYQAAIVGAIRSLRENPHPEGNRTKKLTGNLIASKFIAQYRLHLQLSSVVVIHAKDLYPRHFGFWTKVYPMRCMQFFST